MAEGRNKNVPFYIDDKTCSLQEASITTPHHHYLSSSQYGFFEEVDRRMEDGFPSIVIYYVDFNFTSLYRPSVLYGFFNFHKIYLL